ncbi:hypothetical protein J0X19_15385 [Hymenobacter sp. BT186]|uniref:Uncharacterized protein n=1 Tax=Hymenobacter telluris TaxID=2816474 RepID=A0A939EZD8_9BACT|nr:hypothetical protein [Hymenobacter telluris]MBO0359345.1 hypothetical protein [Hymenobacter telluris]MBW3375371.1 hypothetical protein [Hymenobacter norwichensis]
MTYYSHFVFGWLLLLTSCETKIPVTESNLTGAWRSVNTHKSGYPPDDIIIYKRYKQLFLTTYYGHYEAKLNEAGDSLSLRQGCMVYLLPVSLRLMPDKSPDTLSVSMPSFGKFTRMDSSTFIRNYFSYKRPRKLPLQRRGEDK